MNYRNRETCRLEFPFEMCWASRANLLSGYCCWKALRELSDLRREFAHHVARRREKGSGSQPQDYRRWEVGTEPQGLGRTAGDINHLQSSSLSKTKVAVVAGLLSLQSPSPIRATIEALPWPFGTSSLSDGLAEPIALFFISEVCASLFLQS